MALTDPIAVYAVMHMECVHLQLTLAGNGIDADVEMGAPSDCGVDAHVYVNGADLERAATIVEDFKRKTGTAGRTST